MAQKINPYDKPSLSPRRNPGYRAFPRRAPKGFGLIEVLVAIVILTFGLLGAVGMQAFSIQATRDARLQAQAVGLAAELAEMMRSNKAIAVKPNIADNPYLVASTTMASPNYCLSVSSAATGCTSTTDVARAAMTDWLARVAAELPGARVRICFDDAPYDAQSGLAQWNCSATATQGIVFIKIGWTRASTDKSATGDAALERADVRPSVIFPVTGGTTT